MKETHILLFSFPTKGHIKPFLYLAELLSDAGIHVTFLNTDYNHRRIDNLRPLAGRFPTLLFESISDGLPLDSPRDLLDGAIYVSMLQTTKPLFQELLLSYNGSSGDKGCRRPITCVITDMVFAFPIEVAEELGIPVFSFCPFSARYLLLYFWIPKLIEEGQIPYPDGENDQEIHGVPGGEGLIRGKDLPGFWSAGLVAKYDPMIFVNQTLASTRSSALIINTFDDLEPPFLAHLSTKFPKIYTIGPIHSLLTSHHGLWKEDDGCLRWLDSQRPRSVVFISFGTLAKITVSQLTEFWHGLMNSGKSFLCVLRSDTVGDDESKRVVEEIVETKTEGRGMVVGWAPQEEVLAHQAVGGFFTHSGWNSTLESIAAGVPIISRPNMGDQFSNCTWACKVWKIGLELGRYDRATVELMIRSLMEEEGEEMRKSAAEFSKRAKYGVGKDGTSFQNLRLLIEYIKNIKPYEDGTCSHTDPSQEFGTNVINKIS